MPEIYLPCRALNFFVLSFKINNLKGGDILAQQRRTSARAAKAASRVLRDGRTSRKSKIAAGSALSQRAPKKK